MMEPRIETLEEIRLIGNSVRMSFAANKTKALWQSFMPRRPEIKGTVGSELYSVEVYDTGDFFKRFNPTADFEKWAAVRVHEFHAIPEGMQKLIIAPGKYAVFLYKGKPSAAQATYQHIYGNWIPDSAYDLDDRPHFALMGEKYRGEHPESEEELWIPVKEKREGRGET